MRLRSRLRTLILKELLVPLLALLTIIIVGFVGFMLIEGFSALQSLYVMVITFATIGYGDVVPVTNTGKIFTICLIISGFTV